jgi:hypothetical protein
VLWLDGDLGILCAELYKDEFAAGLEGFLHGGEHDAGLGELMVDVYEEDEVT